MKKVGVSGNRFSHSLTVVLPFKSDMRYGRGMDSKSDIAEESPAREGWALQPFPHTFSAHAGPFLIRKDGPEPGIGFYAKSHHANMQGVIHGGALLTLADMSLWDICRRKVGLFGGATVSLNSEFVGPGKVGTFIEASGDLIRAGHRLIFARGIVTCEGEPLLSFSGTLKINRQ